MKHIFSIPALAIIGILFFSSCGGSSNKHKLVELWETDTIFKTPESVLVDTVNKILYVSNIDGKDGWALDGKGSIGKMGMDGKNILVDWVTGLNAPKGMGIYNGKLYAADPKEVVVIDIAAGKIEKRISVAGAIGLNDIAIDKDGVVYVSDSEGMKIYEIKNDSAQLLLDNLKQANGVLVHNNEFYLLDAGGLYKMNADKKLTKLSEGMEGGTDGVESINGNDFIVTGWDGVLYYVYADGKKEKLLDTRAKELKTADIGVDASKKIVYVPTFWKNTVTAYEVK